MFPSLTLRLLPGVYAISRLDAGALIPPWADGDGFVSISRTATELSILSLAQRVPPGVRSENGWRAFELVGPFPFDAVGVAAAVAQPLAAGGISILLVSTFDTDVLLVKEAHLRRATDLLATAGHRVIPAA
ncbi:MAG TPA: ACT domain-containing protein [Anaeromyxobacter sp.]|nr:ACT domain-containing protein [Anaeromyxobacter sp.]